MKTRRRRDGTGSRRAPLTQVGARRRDSRYPGDAGTGAAIELIRPDWPAPAPVRAATTTRRGGASKAPFDSFNLAHEVGEERAAVERNRALLADRLGLPAPPRWLSQVHGREVAVAHGTVDTPVADACVSDRPGHVCVVLTADCVPVVLCDREGRAVGAAHGGWRGLAGGVIASAVAAMQVPPEGLMAWIGPAIGPGAYEVGNEVREAFLDRDPKASGAFAPSPAGRWLADLAALARLELERAGVGSVHGGGFCTYSDEERFYSYRRDGRTGRMATLIWLSE